MNEGIEFGGLITILLLQLKPNKENTFLKKCTTGGNFFFKIKYKHKDIPYSEVGRSNIVKMVILPKLTTDAI